MRINPNTEHVEELPSKIPNRRTKVGDTIQLTGPCGGGYGNPLERSPEQVHSDVLDEYISRETAERETLLHEYGHILHWRMFDALNLHNQVDIYRWFLESGYTELVDQRTPEFARSEIPRRIYLLKESLVEDYRIWLNFESKSDMCILPNNTCYYGDLLDPTLLEEGVSVMKKMLEPALKNKAVLRNPGFSSEPNRIISARRIYHAAQQSDWTPGVASLTKEDHLRELELFEKKQKHKLLV